MYFNKEIGRICFIDINRELNINKESASIISLSEE